VRCPKLAILCASLAVCAGAQEPDIANEYPIRNRISVSYFLEVSLPEEVLWGDHYHQYINRFCEELRDRYKDRDGLRIGSCEAGSLDPGGMYANGMYSAMKIRLIAPEELGTHAVLAEIRKYPFETPVLLERQETSFYTFEVNDP